MVTRLLDGTNEYSHDGAIIIGVDHGYGNMKTAHCCFKSGIDTKDEEPTVSKEYIKYDGKYYIIGETHLTYQGDKTQAEDYRVLTMAALAQELQYRNVNEADVILAVGLPLAWVGKQKEAFKKYLMEKTDLFFEYKSKSFHVRIKDVKVLSQGISAVMGQNLNGFNMMVDIGNGTMNMMHIHDNKPVEKSIVTEKYGVNQCLKEILHELAKDCGSDFEEEMVEPFIRSGVGERSDTIAKIVKRVCETYTKEIWNRILDNGYKEGITRLYVVGGGGCLLKNHPEIGKKENVIFLDDICANAKGYEKITHQLCVRG